MNRLHFRGLPDATWTTFMPICSTRKEPVSGDVTTEAHAVTCNDCRRVLRMNPRLDVVDESETRYP